MSSRGVTRPSMWVVVDVTGEELPECDIDFLAEFEPGASLINLMTLQDDLEALLGCSDDVVSSGRLKARDEHIRRDNHTQTLIGALWPGFESSLLTTITAPTLT